MCHTHEAGWLEVSGEEGSSALYGKPSDAWRYIGLARTPNAAPRGKGSHPEHCERLIIFVPKDAQYSETYEETFQKILRRKKNYREFFF